MVDAIVVEHLAASHGGAPGVSLRMSATAKLFLVVVFVSFPGGKFSPRMSLIMNLLRAPLRDERSLLSLASSSVLLSHRIRLPQSLARDIFDAIEQCASFSFFPLFRMYFGSAVMVMAKRPLRW